MRAHRDMEFKQCKPHEYRWHWGDNILPRVLATVVRTGDLNEGNLVDKCGGVALDFVIISYVLIYCTNDRTADMLAKLLAVASPQRRSFCLNLSTLRSIDVPCALLG